MKKALQEMTRLFVGRTLITAIAIAGIGIAQANTVASGGWKKKANSTQGSWSIVEENGKVTLKINDLRTKSGPDLKIFLSPRSASSVSGKNATQGSLKVASLKSNKGSQTYTLPAGIDLSKYKSIVIHCQQYSKTWAAGAL